MQNFEHTIGKPEDNDRQQDQPLTPAITDRRSMRILIVDDLPTNTILLRAILQHGGFTNIISTNDGSKALDYCKKHTLNGRCNIDLVLLDIIMPNTNGFSVCRKMQRQPSWKSIPVILITSENKWRDETTRASFDNGATDILFKPVRNTELLPRVTSALSQKWERDLHREYEEKLKSSLDNYQRTEEKLKYIINHDELTGLYSMRRLVQKLNSILHPPHHNDDTYSLLYMDVDNFKVINDAEGHQAGNRFLKEFADFLYLHFNNEVIVARLNGDKFGIIIHDKLPSTSIDKAEKCLTACSEFIFYGEKNYYPVTVSLGLLKIQLNSSKQPSELIEQAKQYCDKSKQMGKNRLSSDMSDNHVEMEQLD